MFDHLLHQPTELRETTYIPYYFITKGYNTVQLMIQDKMWNSELSRPSQSHSPTSFTPVYSPT